MAETINIHDRDWTVAIIGARGHYSDPRALCLKKKLNCFYTDIWCSQGRSFLKLLPDTFSRMASRYHSDLSSQKVVSFNIEGLAYLIMTRMLLRHQSRTKRAQLEIAQGRAFANLVLKHMKRHRRDLIPGVFMGFSMGSLETIEGLSSRGFITVLNQMDAAAEHNHIQQSEYTKWPGWLEHKPVLFEELQRRKEREWRYADVVVSNSEWTKNALLKQGVSADKIAIIPLAFEKEVSGIIRNTRSRTVPLKVIWVARVDLGKGIQYLVEAAKGMDTSRFDFTIVGSIDITQKGLDSAPKNMRFVGKVSRSETTQYYNEGDIYVLPTLSDGFAITQIEAMAHGLPVITTNNCGEVVTHGVDGLIVPAGDSEALRAALERLERNRDEAAAMSRAALEKAKYFTLDSYADKLIGGVEAVLTARNAYVKKSGK